MKIALILHGIGGHAGIHWEQWLSDKLQERGFRVIMPNLPNSKHPDREQWLTEIMQSVQNVETKSLTVIGHSLGATSALDFIEQSPTPTKAFISVSGFAIDYGAELNSYFLREKSIDFKKVDANLGRSAVFYGDDDPYVAPEALQQLADALGVQPAIIHDGGHLNTERGYTDFPALLDKVIELSA